ncbi:SDR family oxidoreductase [Mycetocola zhujimingii]|uniref:SDR family oxidoreductase n=1 Tax=Mycetocola zhujimingii TaxID=2079792 RepID=UPI0013C4790F
MTLEAAAGALRDGGVLVVAAWIRGYLPNTSSIDYAASKAAALSVMKSFAKELGPRRLRANAVAPGRIETELTERGAGLLEQRAGRTSPRRRSVASWRSPAQMRPAPSPPAPS